MTINELHGTQCLRACLQPQCPHNPHSPSATTIKRYARGTAADERSCGFDAAALSRRKPVNRTAQRQVAAASACGDIRRWADGSAMRARNSAGLVGVLSVGAPAPAPSPAPALSSSICQHQRTRAEDTVTSEVVSGVRVGRWVGVWGGGSGGAGGLIYICMKFH